MACACLVSTSDLTTAAASGPLAAIHPPDFWETEAWNAGLLGGIEGLGAAGRANPGVLPEIDPLVQAAHSWVVHQGFWTTYATYRDARLQAKSDTWDGSWQPETADRLLLAPFNWRNYDHTIVLIALGGVIALGAIGAAAYCAQPGFAPPRPGLLTENLGLGLVSSFDGGVTEEARFRGTIYEELKYTLGLWPARLVDMSFFTLAHVPAELDLPINVILEGAAVRALFALTAEVAYDQGGLPEAVALHVVWDLALFSVGALTGTTPFAV